MGASLTLDLQQSLPREQAVSLEDLRLVEELRAGAESAYETLIARFQQPVYNLAARLLDESRDAGDVAQEVFLKVFRNIGQFRGQSSLRTWVYRIAVNEVYNRRRWIFRHRRNEVALEEESADAGRRERSIPDPGRSPFDRAFDREKHVVIEDALARINPNFRAAVVLRDMEDLSYDEIAEVLQISIGTVKSRIMRGREALREELLGRLNPGPALNWVPGPAK